MKTSKSDRKDLDMGRVEEVMSEEAGKRPGSGARIVAGAIGSGAALMLVLGIYFGVMDTVPMNISAEAAEAAGCPHRPPARFGTTWWDYVFALRGLTIGGDCRELSASWLFAEGREWLWIFGASSLCIGWAGWNKHRGFAMVCTGAGVATGAAAAWVSVAM